DSIDVFDEEDNFHTAAALSCWEQVWAFDFPVWRIPCCQLESGLPVRQFSIFACVASHHMEAQDALKPGDGLFEVAHTQLDPACFSHLNPLSNCVSSAACTCARILFSSNMSLI